MQILQPAEGFLCNKLFFAGTTISEIYTEPIDEILHFRRHTATTLSDRIWAL
jgi:hypothetical protein